MIYEKSPDGVLATARRVEAYRPQVEAAAAEAGVDPDLVEGMVFLESAGRPEVMASTDVEGAVGLTQILAETAVSLLGMRVDVEESQRLTRKIMRADREGASARSEELRARRRRVDERFDPDKALAGTGRYLRTAMDEFGREDLAVASYHMGIGNLQNVLAAYGEDDVSYTQVYFDATPDRHPETYRLLTDLGDDSKTYLWRVLAVGGGDAALPRGSRRARAARRPAVGQGERRGGAAPAGLDRDLRVGRRPRGRVRGRAAAAVPEPAGALRPAARPAHGRARRAGRHRPRSSSAACAPRRSRWRSTWRRRSARSPTRMPR